VVVDGKSRTGVRHFSCRWPGYSDFLLVLSAGFGRMTVPLTLTVFPSPLESPSVDASSTVALYAE
jgi:hypothetical protein